MLYRKLVRFLAISQQTSLYFVPNESPKEFEFSFGDANAVAHVAASLSKVATIIKRFQDIMLRIVLFVVSPLPPLSMPVKAILMADQWDLYNEPGVDFIKHTPCPALNALPPFYFIFRTPQKHSQRRNETEYKELKMKRNLISQKIKKEEETRVFMCAATRDCEADLTILDTVLVYLSLSFCLFLHLQLSVSVPVLLPVSNLFCSLSLSGQREVAGLCCCTF